MKMDEQRELIMNPMRANNKGRHRGGGGEKGRLPLIPGTTPC